MPVSEVTPELLTTDITAVLLLLQERQWGVQIATATLRLLTISLLAENDKLAE